MDCTPTWTIPITGTRVPTYHNHPTAAYLHRRPHQSAAAVSNSKAAAQESVRATPTSVSATYGSSRLCGQRVWPTYPIQERTAFPSRFDSAKFSNEETAPAARWTAIVTAHDAAESSKKGIFSTI